MYGIIKNIHILIRLCNVYIYDLAYLFTPSKALLGLA